MTQEIAELIEKSELSLRENVADQPSFSEEDALLITYADQVQKEGEETLQTLSHFYKKYLKNSISIVHLLPFYPWTSDDGFSVVEYDQVDQRYGSWEDIKNFNCPIMADAVFNHCSSQNSFFQNALQGDKEALDFFITFDITKKEDKEFNEHISNVVRPRTHDLLTEYEFNGGEKRLVWTTFSEDQVDTNFRNFKFLKYSIECLLLYFKNNTKWVRIDAVPFFWKELGTNCSHLPKTHEIVKLYRTIADSLEGDFVIMTESNVPHHENITYWGNGNDEAQLIYNFTLPSLLTHAYINQTADKLHHWSNKLETPSQLTTMFNINATHDGVGVRGMEGHVDDYDIDVVANYVVEKGGFVNYKTSRKKGKRPYELNITWTSLLKENHLDQETNLRKVIASHLITYAFPGVPGIYFHNLMASENWVDGVRESGMNRRINRQKLSLKQVEERLQSDMFAKEVFKQLTNALEQRKGFDCFHPNAQKIDMNLHEKVWSFKRIGRLTTLEIHCSFSEETIEMSIQKDMVNVLDDSQFDGHLKPFEIVWLKDKS